MTSVLTPDLVREWLRRARIALAAARTQIDALNVYPVPDGDTGTNLFLTMDAAVDAVAAASGPTGDRRTPLTAAEVARAAATGALLGARGNSGVILAQMLRGVADELGARPAGASLDADVVRGMLRRAADLGYQAVSRPVEGTILTVARAAAEAAEAATTSTGSAAQSAIAAAAGARAALARTPQMLEALRLAGVVDAGGQGLVEVLDALAGVTSGAVGPVDVELPAVADPVVAHRAYGGPAYEVMFLFDAAPTGAEAEPVEALREQLDALGDSVVVVGGDGLWNVHAHVDDAGSAIEAALGLGRPHRIRVTYLEPVNAGRGRAVVAVTHGPGIAALMGECGVAAVAAGPRRRPSTAEILDAIVRTHAAQVLVLPSDAETCAVAEQAALQARESGIRVSVIPTRSVVQTLAAVAVHDPGISFDDDVVAMTRAVGATRYGAVTVASRAALTTVGPCASGDVLGLVDGDIVAIGTEPGAVARDLLRAMLAAGGELVTIVRGADATEALGADLADWLGRDYPLVDVVTHDGGQPLWPLIVGVE